MGITKVGLVNYLWGKGMDYNQGRLQESIFVVLVMCNLLTWVMVICISLHKYSLNCASKFYAVFCIHDIYHNEKIYFQNIHFTPLLKILQLLFSFIHNIKSKLLEVYRVFFINCSPCPVLYY